ncbi:MAG: dual specificity protein phosphatase family protein [Weeksellaceae bacterium]
MQQLTSFIMTIVIDIQRVIDHTYRRIVGLPQLKRSQITGEVFLGGQYGIHAVTTMEKLGITGIVNMRTRGLYDAELQNKFHILNLPTPDLHAPSIENLQKGVAFIDKQIKQKGKVYIHCHHGEGRGASMVIAYLISQGMTYDDAFAHVKKVRTFIRPTAVQVKRLREFAKLYELKK